MWVLSCLCVGLSISRALYTGTKMFLFLNRNLFLALMPRLLTTFMIIEPSIQKMKISKFIILLFRLLFFPNAPYILTDLIHLKTEPIVPLRFDLFLILSFARTGMLFGFLSLRDIEKVLEKSIKKATIAVISSCLLFVWAFGIYLGRYLRRNSRDMISKPLWLLYSIGDRFANLSEYPWIRGMTIFVWVFLNIIYRSFKLVSKKYKE